MTDTYKVLGQSLTGELALDNSTVKETIAYQVPAGTKTSVSAIEITNSDSASQTYKLAFIPSADVESASTTISYTSSETIEIPLVVVGTFQNGVSTDKAAYSQDGVNWSLVTLPYSQPWSCIKYGNGKFVAFAQQSSQSVYSSDGLSWSGTIVPYGLYRSIAYGNGKFVAITGDGKIVYSSDGIDWTQAASYSMVPLNDIVYANNMFIVVAGDGMFAKNTYYYSSDGVIWNTSTLPNTSAHLNIVYGNSKFFVLHSSMMGGGIQYSSDGLSWQESALPSMMFFPKLFYVNEKFIITSNNDNKYYYSSDGTTWTEASGPVSSRGISYKNGKYIAIGDYGNTYYYSTDAINWSTGDLPVGGPAPGWSAISSGSSTSSQTLNQTIFTSLNKHVAIYNKTIAAGETHEIKGGVTLSAGDQIRVYSDSAEIITNVYGVEIA